MPARLLNESFETSGEWYLPEAPERKIPGILRYTPERTELHLHESFVPLEGTIHLGQTRQTYPVVHGTTRDSEAITLLNAQRAGWSLRIGTGGLRQPETLVCSWLLIGARMPADFAYRELRLRVPGLQVWLCRPILDASFDPEKTMGDTVGSYHIRGVPKESIWVPSIKSNLDWYFSWQSKCDPFSSIAVTVSAWVGIRPETPKGLYWYFEQVGKISTMLAFLAGSPMSPDCIEASIGEGYQEVYVMPALRDAKCCPYVDLDEFFMSRGDMGSELTDVVTRWFDLYPKVHMPSQLALSVLASERLWLHVEFLSLMQALEGLHRALFVGNYMNDKEYEAVEKALVDAIAVGLSPEHKDAIRSRIRYGNQISLHKRLDDLAARLGEQIRGTILGNGGDVPRTWVDTRNYYTHWDEELRANMLDGQGIYNAVVRLRHFLRVSYLMLMGIPDHALLKSLSNRSRSSQHLVQLNMIERRENKK
jgi:hypothetical protein